MNINDRVSLYTKSQVHEQVWEEILFQVSNKIWGRVELKVLDQIWRQAVTNVQYPIEDQLNEH